MTELEHAVEILFDEGGEESGEAEGEAVVDLVSEEAAVAVGDEDVAVTPEGEGAFLLDVGEEAVVLVFGVDGDPGFVEGSKVDAELDAGADTEAAVAGDDLDLLPRREEEGEDVGALVEGEDVGRGRGEAGLVDELCHL